MTTTTLCLSPSSTWNWPRPVWLLQISAGFSRTDWCFTRTSLARHERRSSLCPALCVLQNSFSPLATGLQTDPSSGWEHLENTIHIVLYCVGYPVKEICGFPIPMVVVVVVVVADLVSCWQRKVVYGPYISPLFEISTWKENCTFCHYVLLCLLEIWCTIQVYILRMNKEMYHHQSIIDRHEKKHKG